MTTLQIENLQLQDAIVDATDRTKKAKLSLATIPSATTRTYVLPNANTTLVGTDVAQTLTNKTITAASNNVAANSLKTTGTAVTVATAAPPTTGQVLTATSATAANWQTPAASSLSVYFNQGGVTTLNPLSGLKQWYGKIGTTGNSGTFNITVDGTAGGTPIFANLADCFIYVSPQWPLPTTSDLSISLRSTAVDNRTAIVNIRRPTGGPTILTVTMYVIGA